MVLHHVAQRAGLLVERPAPFHTQRLRCRDLHVIDVIAIPDRLEDPVGEPEHQNVLHRLFAQVVIDAEDLVLVEHRVHLVIQVARRIEIVPKRLLDHHAHAPLLRLRHALRAQVLDNRRKVLRRRRQVEQPVRPDVLLLRNLVQLLPSVPRSAKHRRNSARSS